MAHRQQAPNEKRRRNQRTFVFTEPNFTGKKRIRIDDRTSIWIGVSEDEDKERERYEANRALYNETYTQSFRTILRNKRKK